MSAEMPIKELIGDFPLGVRIRKVIRDFSSITEVKVDNTLGDILTSAHDILRKIGYEEVIVKGDDDKYYGLTLVLSCGEIDPAIINCNGE